MSTHDGVVVHGVLAELTAGHVVHGDDAVTHAQLVRCVGDDPADDAVAAAGAPGGLLVQINMFRYFVVHRLPPP